jgi:hypothetical protein
MQEQTKYNVSTRLRGFCVTRFRAGRTDYISPLIVCVFSNTLRLSFQKSTTDRARKTGHERQRKKDSASGRVILGTDLEIGKPNTRRAKSKRTTRRTSTPRHQGVAAGGFCVTHFRACRTDYIA